MKNITTLLIFLSFTLLLFGCDDKPLNYPHDADQDHENVYYSSFSERPKTLDPARSYSSNEILFTGQIYEPPLQYHYLKRPFTLIPLTAADLPKAKYFDKQGHALLDNAPAKAIAYTVYRIQIQPGINYQPHPAFAHDKEGNYLYHDMSVDQAEDIYSLADFSQTDTRELTAADYVYQIKRLAHPALQSPILGLMSEYIVGLKELSETLDKIADETKQNYFDLRQFSLEGAKVIDRYSYEVKVKGKYPQLLYWLAMPFFAPIPWEADVFYSQAGMKEHNITFDWYPIGTGPYMLTENNPNRQMVLEKNPNFHGENYPSEGTAEDLAAGLLDDAGKPLPFIEKYIFSLEKETIPRWNKFLQGYYDASSISSDSFDQAVYVDETGQPHLTETMQKQKIKLQTSVGVSTFYMGFNMLDDVVGGFSQRARKIRQALAIALDYEEFISIFSNGRGIPAQGPLPPGIFGHLDGEKGVNPYVYRWEKDRVKRLDLAIAKRLLSEAGYPNGREANTGKPLTLNYDVPASSGPDDKARFDWMRKQFEKLGIQLHVRATQYNRFQQKMRDGNAQIFAWGWNADYPDPENFLFLLYGPNGKVKFGGENASNYSNAEFDALFDEMKHMKNGPKRQAVINQMVDIVRKDSPWIWGFHPKNFSLSQSWVGPMKPTEIGNNTLKYTKIHAELRNSSYEKWNKPIFWPLWMFVGLFGAGVVPVAVRYWKREHGTSHTG